MLLLAGVSRALRMAQCSSALFIIRRCGLRTPTVARIEELTFGGIVGARNVERRVSAATQIALSLVSVHSVVIFPAI